MFTRRPSCHNPAEATPLPDTLPTLADALARHPAILLGPPTWALLLLTLPRDRASAALLALSSALTAAAFTPRLHYHFDRGYAELMAAAGLGPVDTAYGEGWVALMFTPTWLTGRPDAVHVANAALTALAAPHLAAALAAWGHRAAGLIAGVLLAASPLSLGMAGSETRYVPIAALTAAALHGLARRDRRGDALLVVSAGLVGHLRPFELWIPLTFALAARRPAAAGLVVAALLRLGSWVGSPPKPGGAFGEGFGMLWDRPWIGPDARFVMLDPTVTPFGLPLLAGVALIATPRDPTLRRPALAFAGALALTSLLYAPQPLRPDQLRFALTLQPWLAALAALGLTSLPARARLHAALLVAASWWPARHPLPTFPWQAEYALLRTALADLPPDSVVAYDPAIDRGDQRRWAALHAGVHLVARDEAPPDTRWRWIGLADHRDGPVSPAGTPVVVATVLTDPWGLWGGADTAPHPVPLGLYDLRPTPRSPPPSASPAPSPSPAD